jgi:hypothetical protein
MYFVPSSDIKIIWMNKVYFVYKKTVLNLKFTIVSLNGLTTSIHNFWGWCCHIYSSCSSMMQHYMIVLVYLGSQCTELYAACWTFRFFTSFYLELCVRPGAISRWIRQRNNATNLGKSATDTLAMVRQAFGNEA